MTLFTLPDYRDEHNEKLKSYKFDKCTKEYVVFFQVFYNPSFPNTFKIFFNRNDSRYDLFGINRGTGTPEPWVGYFETIFIGEYALLDKIYSSVKPYHQGDNVYYINTDEIDDLIHKSQIETLSLNDARRGLILIKSKIVNHDDRLGFVYCMVHPRSDRLCKIGLSDRDPRVRAAELSIDAGLPDSYKPIFILSTSNAKILESNIHEKLDENNLRINKEHFKIDVMKILNIFVRFLKEDKSVFGIHTYTENAKFFTESNLPLLINFISAEQKKEKTKNTRISTYSNSINLYQDRFLFLLKDSYYQEYSDLRTKSLRERLYELQAAKRMLELQISNLDSKSNDITKIGGIASVASLPFDGGLSLAAAALGALGLYGNSKKKGNKRDLLEKVNSQIYDLEQKIKLKNDELPKIIKDFSLSLSEFSGEACDLYNKKTNIKIGFLVSLYQKNDKSKKTIINYAFLSVGLIDDPDIFYLKLVLDNSNTIDYAPYQIADVEKRNSVDINNIPLIDFFELMSFVWKNDIPALNLIYSDTSTHELVLKLWKKTKGAVHVLDCQSVVSILNNPISKNKRVTLVKKKPVSKKVALTKKATVKAKTISKKKILNKRLVIKKKTVVKKK
jgi:hypothetical protein